MTLCIAGYCRFCALLLLQKFCQENYDCSICNMAGKVKHNQRQTVQKITRQSVIIEHLTLECETTFRTWDYLGYIFFLSFFRTYYSIWGGGGIFSYRKWESEFVILLFTIDCRNVEFSGFLLKIPFPWIGVLRGILSVCSGDLVSYGGGAGGAPLGNSPR